MSEPVKCWWFAIDKETLRMVEVAEGTPGAFAFRQVAPVDRAEMDRAKKLADYCDAFSSGVMREIAELLRKAYL